MLQTVKEGSCPQSKREGNKRMLNGSKPNANDISFSELSMEISPLIVHTHGSLSFNFTSLTIICNETVMSEINFVIALTYEAESSIPMDHIRPIIIE